MTVRAESWLWPVAITAALLLHAGLGLALLGARKEAAPEPPPFEVTISTLPTTAGLAAVTAQRVATAVASAIATPAHTAAPVVAIPVVPPAVAGPAIPVQARPVTPAASAPVAPAAVVPVAPLAIQALDQAPVPAGMPEPATTLAPRAPVTAAASTSASTAASVSAAVATPSGQSTVAAPGTSPVLAAEAATLPALDTSPALATAAPVATGAAAAVSLAPIVATATDPADSVAPAPTLPPIATSAPAAGPPTAATATSPPAAAAVPTAPPMQLAAVEPEIVVQPPAPVVTSPADDLAEFVNAFDGGDCFAAQVAGEPDTPTLVAFAVDFADSVALQFALSRDFPQAVQFAGYRAEAAQCGALHFVSRLQRMGSAPATVVLEAERIADGGEIVGRASVPAHTTVHLFIVDDEGIVSDATDYLAADGAFAAPVRLTGPQGAGRLQLVIALGASAPVTPPTGQQPAAEYFATLADQMGEAGGDHAVAIAAFAIE